MILIVGASGFLGRAVAKLLLSEGQQVRLLVRTPAKVDDVKQMGADRVFAAAHSMLGRGRYTSEAVDGAGHRALIDAVKAAGVAYFVYMSMLGVSPDHPFDFARTKYHIEEYLKASDLSYTILRPAAFMECTRTSSMAKPFWKAAKRVWWARAPNSATL